MKSILQYMLFGILVSDKVLKKIYESNKTKKP